MKHFILTRFNLGLYDRPGIDPDWWVARRLDLFGQITVPSIRAQIEKRFTWWVFFDQRTPRRFLRRAADVLEPGPQDGHEAQIMIVRPPSPDSFDTAVDMIRGLPGLPGKVITTRLDNDDAVSADFVQTVQDLAFLAGDRTVINFLDGWRADWWAGRAAPLKKGLNPFLSLVETVDDPAELQTCWAENHHRMDKVGRAYNVSGPRRWIQFAHGGNLKNIPAESAEAVDLSAVAPNFGFFL